VAGQRGLVFGPGRLLFRPGAPSGRTQGEHQHGGRDEGDEHDPDRADVHRVDERLVGRLRQGGPVERGGDVAGLFRRNPDAVLQRLRDVPHRGFDGAPVGDRHDRAAHRDPDHAAGLPRRVGDGGSGTGLFQRQAADYQISGSTVTFFLASVPQSGDLLVANYRFASPSPLILLASPQVVCSSTGSSTSGTALVELGSCTIAAGTLGVGDRLEIQFQYGHAGTATGFTGDVQVGGTTVASRAADSTETLLAGRTSFGIDGDGQAWDTQTWGVGLILMVTAGTASEDLSQAVRVSLRGQMAGTTSDTVFLRNFTVIRYPAQTNP